MLYQLRTLYLKVDKFQLVKGATLDYAWKTNGAKLYFDFHGEPKGDKTGYFKSFEVNTDHQASGALIAPFEGIHGWYWENKTTAPITVFLNTKGIYFKYQVSHINRRNNLTKSHKT